MTDRLCGCVIYDLAYPTDEHSSPAMKTTRWGLSWICFFLYSVSARNLHNVIIERRLSGRNIIFLNCVCCAVCPLPTPWRTNKLSCAMMAHCARIFLELCASSDIQNFIDCERKTLRASAVFPWEMNCFMVIQIIWANRKKIYAIRRQDVLSHMVLKFFQADLVVMFNRDAISPLSIQILLLGLHWSLLFS